MIVQNALASVAVRDLHAAVRWYEEVLESPASTPMPEVAEWRFPRGGALQIYREPERAGEGSCTLAVDELDELDEIGRKPAAMGIDTCRRGSNDAVETLMVADPDGNHIAFAVAYDRRLAS